MTDPLSVLTEQEREAIDRLRRLLSGENIYSVYDDASKHPAVRRALARADLTLLATELAALREERQPTYSPEGGAQILPGGRLGCYDCGRQYGDEFGFPDLVIDNAAFAAIAPNPPDGGLLCPSCICKRLFDAGLGGVQGEFKSGPLQAERASKCKVEFKFDERSLVTLEELAERGLLPPALGITLTQEERA